jgi:hypothetical protein
MTALGGKPADAVDAFLQGLSGVSSRRVADGEWGLVVEDVGGLPLEIGLRLADGLLSAQAWVCAPGGAAPEVLLHRNRLVPLVRLACSRSGDVHVHADVPAAAVGADGVLGRLLVGLVEAADIVRSA